MRIEKFAMCGFGCAFAMLTIAAVVGACLGYTWHIYTAICSAALSAICFNEIRKLNKEL